MAPARKRARKAPARKAPSRKVPARTSSTAKKAAAKRATTKRATTKKTTAKKTLRKKTGTTKMASRKPTRPAVKTVGGAGRKPRASATRGRSAGRGPAPSGDRFRRLYELAQRKTAEDDRDRQIDRALQQPVEAVRPGEPAVEPAVAVETFEGNGRSRTGGILVREDQPTVGEAAVPSHRVPAGDLVIDVEDLRVFYGAVAALKGVSFHVRQGEVVSIIGSNGAGKTTTMKTVSGVSEMLKHVRGRITVLGQRVESTAAHRISRLGLAHVPEGRKVFPNQTVRDNLMLGAFQRKDAEIDKDIDAQYERFPILGQRRNQPAGLMSGGEQQMLAIARGLMARPKAMLFDEPSMGLAPLIVKQVFEILEELKREGMTILLVEQMAFQALGIADRAYVLETGEITMEGTGEQLLNDPKVKEAYLGA